MTEKSPPDEQARFRLKCIQPLLDTTPLSARRLQEQAARVGRSPRTLQRWLRRYRESGEAGLCRATGRRSGKHAAWESFVRQQYLDRRQPTVAAVHGLCRQKAAKEGGAPPSYATVRRMIQRIPRGVCAYYRDRKRFKNKYQATGQLFQASYPGELHLIDHRRMDVLIRPAKTGGKASRPWITGELDQYSRSLAGYHVGRSSPSSRRVALALRHAILPKNDPRYPVCGIPTMLRHDLGKDLVSRHIEQVKIDLKIQNLPKEAANPRANAEIERFFGTMAQWEKGLPGWTGANVRQRPETIKAQLSLTDLKRLFRSFLESYHGRKHSGTQMTPIERWQTGLIPRLPESEAALDLLLMPVARGRKIRRNGIHFLTHRYWSDKLLLYIGEVATLRYDPSHLEEIIVYVDNRRIGPVLRVGVGRLNYEDYRKRRARQVRVIRDFAKGGSSRQSPPSADTESEDTVRTLIDNYRDRMEKCPREKGIGPIKPFPEPEEGGEWW